MSHNHYLLSPATKEGFRSSADVVTRGDDEFKLSGRHLLFQTSIVKILSALYRALRDHLCQCPKFFNIQMTFFAVQQQVEIQLKADVGRSRVA
jgi:hypothetical protein